MQKIYFEVPAIPTFTSNNDSAEMLSIVMGKLFVVVLVVSFQRETHARRPDVFYKKPSDFFFHQKLFLTSYLINRKKNLKDTFRDQNHDTLIVLLQRYLNGLKKLFLFF